MAAGKPRWWRFPSSALGLEILQSRGSLNIYAFEISYQLKINKLHTRISCLHQTHCFKTFEKPLVLEVLQFDTYTSYICFSQSRSDWLLPVVALARDKHSAADGNVANNMRNETIEELAPVDGHEPHQKIHLSLP
ncbi:hypothetical protein SELMODRAFT_406980 [Selaginella moellendorffii]|uniref:Uncharacterized protein n=1 Tax=Selaginella moellendorffii TaxID=88036 RepID=D8R3J1_SELML|nr:hypothetical protein SELMODRAFT_422382 [Selaginella moellendorffii]EFJ32953.1 hypothetical protein SELMODRAFT_406980 [Selaginella moellendorffii]